VSILDQIRDTYTQRHTIPGILDKELTRLIKQAMDEGHKAPELAELLGVSRARIYQLKEGKR
jgi:plasmid maintenance system antidote protein VapI